MRMQAINPPLRDGQQVQCCACGRMSAGSNPDRAKADLDGKAFAAFYCHSCWPIHETKKENGEC